MRRSGRSWTVDEKGFIKQQPSCLLAFQVEFIYLYPPLAPSVPFVSLNKRKAASYETLLHLIRDIVTCRSQQ